MSKSNFFIESEIKFVDNCYYKKIKFDDGDNLLSMYSFDKESYSSICKHENNLQSDYSIYFLTMQKIENNQIINELYVGQTIDIKSRLNDHSNKKIFKKIICFTHPNWHETEITNIEPYFIDYFMNNQSFYNCTNTKKESIKRKELEPKVRKKIDIWIEQIKKLLLFADIDTYNEKSQNSLNNEYVEINNSSPDIIEVSYLNQKAIYYHNNQRKNNLKLLKDTIVIKNEFDHDNAKKYNEFFVSNIDNLKLIDSNDNQKKYKLLTDIYVSCSLGAQVVRGYHSMRGPERWKDKDGNSINKIKERTK